MTKARAMKFFGPLAIVVGALDIGDGVMALVANETCDDCLFYFVGTKPLASGILLVVIGILLIRATRPQSDRSESQASVRPNGRL